MLALSVAASPAWGQVGAAQNDQITLNLQDVDIRVLINTVAEVTGRNFVVDPRVKGNVSIISGSPLGSEQLYDVFLSILEVHNFAAVESDTLIKILPNNVIKQRPTRTEFSETDLNNDSQITQIIQLEHASVAELVPIIRPLVPPTSHFAAHGPSNTLVVTDTAANIKRMMEIIKRIDVEDKRTGVHVVYLKHADANELAGTLTQLANTMTNSGEGAPGAAASTIQAHPSINALVLNSSDTEFSTLLSLIDQLDIERAVEGDVHVIYLKHANAEGLVSILTEVTRSNSGEAADEVSVQADDPTNSLVIHAKDSQFLAIEAVVEKLDVRRAQVFVETVIAEVSVNKAADLGIELTQLTRPNTPTGSTEVGTDFSDIAGGLTYSLINNSFGKFNLDAVLSALRADSNSNILSTPTILTLDNETASIVVGQEVPFVTGSYGNTGSSSTASSTDEDGNTVVTGGVNPFQTIERKEIGIQLEITPQINDGDTIVLEVMQEISSINERSIGVATDLITDLRTITATVQVDDGQVIVLGGLIRDDIVDTVEWVPILGKIPVIGALFRKKSKQVTKRNLMVFLRPRIIRTAAELEDYSRERYETIRDVTREGQPDTHRMIEGSHPSILPEYDEVNDNTDRQIIHDATIEHDGN